MLSVPSPVLPTTTTRRGGGSDHLPQQRLVAVRHLIATRLNRRGCCVGSAKPSKRIGAPRRRLQHVGSPDAEARAWKVSTPARRATTSVSVSHQDRLAPASIGSIQRSASSAAVTVLPTSVSAPVRQKQHRGDLPPTDRPARRSSNVPRRNRAVPTGTVGGRSGRANHPRAASACARAGALEVTEDHRDDMALRGANVERGTDRLSKPVGQLSGRARRRVHGSAQPQHRGQDHHRRGRRAVDERARC